jgi:hypothetical protein
MGLTGAKRLVNEFEIDTKVAVRHARRRSPVEVSKWKRS